MRYCLKRQVAWDGIEWPTPAFFRAVSLTFGPFFFDYDLESYPDIFAANGHIEEQIGRVQPEV